MATIQLGHGTSLDALLLETSCAGATLVNFSAGWDDRLYLLYSRPNPQSPEKATYTAILCEVDWTPVFAIRTHRVIPLDTRASAPYFLQPLGDCLLLVDPRCHLFRDGRAEQNALLLTQEGQFVREFCLGDGIESCLTTADERIVTGYFDEGIFGHHGWESPIGAPGVIVWDAQGVPLWKNERRPVCDCYALNLDASGWVWYDYYTEFELVGTDGAHELVLFPRISGAHHFAFSPDGNRLLFSGGYHDPKFYRFRLRWNRLLLRETLSLRAEKKPFTPVRCSFYAHHLLFLGVDNRLYGYDFH